MADRAVHALERTPPNRPVGSDADLAILGAVAYADIFDYPLTEWEVHANLVGMAAPPSVVTIRLRALVDAGRLVHCEDFYALPGRDSLAEVRHRRRRTSARLWPEGIRYGRMIAQLPFVRMVAITGSLAVDNAAGDGDIDYLVVTAAGRVWVARGMASLLRRVTLSRGIRLCPNYVLSEETLAIRDRNLYTAHELVQMVPVAGHGVYQRMRELNAWTGDFLPNYPRVPASGAEVRKAALGRIAEAALARRLGGWLERRERARVVRKVVPRAESLAEAVYSDTCCKDHVHAHCERILAAFAERVKRATGEGA